MMPWLRAKHNSNLAQLCQHTISQKKEGMMPISLFSLFVTLQHTIAGAVAAQFDAISGRNGVLGFNFDDQAYKSCQSV